MTDVLVLEAVVDLLIHVTVVRIRRPVVVILDTFRIKCHDLLRIREGIPVG